MAKLLARGEGWLPAHPQRDLIVSRYLGRRRSLVNAALARLIEADGSEPETVLDPAARVDVEAAIEKPLRLHERRLDRVCEIIAAAGAKRVLDLGCGSGKLLARLIRQRGIEEIVGVEVSSFELARATKHFARLPEGVRRRLKLWHGSLTYRDARLRGFDAAALVEVVEHLEPDRLVQLEGSLFGDARPRLIVVTTPNRDYNALFATLEPSRLRHPDHRFEWSRHEFQHWADAVAAGTATTCDWRAWATSTRTWAPPVRWRCSRPMRITDPRVLSRVADRRLWLRQIDLCATAFQTDRDRLLGRLPRARRRRREQPGGHAPRRSRSFTPFWICVSSRRN